MLLACPDVLGANEVWTRWDVRYSHSAGLQQGKAGLADLYVPLGPEDVVGGRNTEQQSSEKTATETAPFLLPFQHRGPPRAAIVVIHGGGWLVGDKFSMGRYSQRLAELGCVVLNVNYRLAPGAKFPAQVDDVREALLYLVEQAEPLGIDLHRIGLFGYSAGGHLATLVGVMADEPIGVQATSSAWPVDDPRWSRLPEIAAVCAGGPPCDLRVAPLDSEALSFFLTGPRRQYPERYVAASPTAHVSGGDPPIQLIHGEKDLIVPIQSSKDFVAALRATGGDVALTVIQNQGHLVTFMHPQTLQGVLDFFSERLLGASP